MYRKRIQKKPQRVYKQRFRGANYLLVLEHNGLDDNGNATGILTVNVQSHDGAGCIDYFALASYSVYTNNLENLLIESKTVRQFYIKKANEAYYGE